MIFISPISTWIFHFSLSHSATSISGSGPIAADVGPPRCGGNTRHAASSTAAHGADAGGEDVESGLFAAAARGRST